MTLALSLIFFLSGAAALVFETVWFREAGLMLGNSVWASSLVMASFMGGLAIGSILSSRRGDRLRDPVRFYALLEGTIAISGYGLVLLLPTITPLLAPLFRPFLETPVLLNGLRLTLAFGLILVPATAMGATLPVLIRAVAWRQRDFGQALGLLYGWNTLGAVAGSVLGESVLIDRLGIRGAGAVAASLNLAAGLATLALARRVGAAAPASGPEKVLGRRARALLAAAFLCGALLLALEVVWFRLLLLFVFANSLTFAVMLAVVLLGISLGSLGVLVWLRYQAEAETCLPELAALAGMTTVLAYSRFAGVVTRYGNRFLTDLPSIATVSLHLMLPTCVLSGAIFALLGKRLKEALGGESRPTALLTLANTVGAMSGALLGGFVLLPLLGIERSVFALGLGYGLVGLSLWIGRRERSSEPVRSMVLPALSAASLAAVLLFFPFGLMKNAFLRIAVSRWPDQGHVLEVREGLLETIVYLRKDLWGEPVSHRLLVNGFSMSSSSVANRRYMNLFVYLPVALHPGMKNALLISYGVGSTAKALTDTAELSRIDVVDISRDVLESGRALFPPPEKHPLDDPRVRVHVEDGRFFLLTNRERYDLITAEPPPLKSAGVVSLYSQEYFQLAHERLAEGGMLSYWLPVNQMTPRESKAVVKAFCSAFEDCSLWTGFGYEWVLFGTRGAQGPVSEERFSRQWRDPVVAPTLRALGLESPEQLGGLFLADAGTLAEETRDVPPLDDDHPRRMGSAFVFVADASYQAFMDTDLTRERFGASALIRRLWPDSLRARSLAAFRTQGWLNGYARAGARRAGLPELAGYLTETSLRTPVLWLLGSGVREQEIAARAKARGVDDPALDELLAVEALSNRDYLEAEARFRTAQARSSAPERLLQLRVLSLCLAGRKGAAAALGGTASHDVEAKAVADWAWLEASCGVPSPVARVR
jgi:spermidine synthase